MRRRGTALVAAAAALALGLAACGGDDFENEPRPPVPVEVSIQVNDKNVTISPIEFGAGIANFTVINLGEVTTAVEIEGPTTGTTEEIAPGNTSELRMTVETGDYEAEAPDSDAEPFAFTVGPERESASDELLLP